MRDVDAFGVWNMGRTVFMAWFAVAISIANYLYLRLATRLSVRRSIVANVAISGLSWLFIAFIPIPLYVCAIGGTLFRVGCCHPISWVIPVVLSAAAGALLGITILLVLRQKVTQSKGWQLLSTNLVAVGIGVWRMTVYVTALPLEP
jgi:hypothetical protein